MESSQMVVDTNIFINYLRAKDKTKTTLLNLPDDVELFISSVTLYELLIGANSEEKLADVKKLTDDIPTLAFNNKVAEHAAKIYRDLKKSNTLIEVRDIFIAATALAYGLPLLTENVKDFKRIKNLELL